MFASSECRLKTANRRRTTASNNPSHADLDDNLKRKLPNPDIRAAYEAVDKRIELVLQVIKLPQRRGMTQADRVKAVGTRQANLRRRKRFNTNLTLGTLEKVTRALAQAGVQRAKAEHQSKAEEELKKQAGDQLGEQGGQLPRGILGGKKGE